MSEAIPSRPSRWSQSWPRRTWWVWALVGALVGLLAWVGVRGWIAKGELETAQALISQMKQQAYDFDVSGAATTLDQISDHTDAAVSLTSDPAWRLFELIPVAGANFSAVRELAGAAQDVLADVATPLMDVLGTVDPASLAPKDGAIDLEPFIKAIPAIAKANEGAKAAIETVASINTQGAVGPVAAAKDKVAELLDEVAPLLDTLDSVLPMLPPALGSEGPRTYVIMFQNNAESRSLGGTALSFALMRVDDGKIQLERTVAAGFKNFTQYTQSVVPIPDGADQIYPDRAYGTFIANVTVRPDFVTAAEMTQQMWYNEFGYSVDGIVSIDPVALSYVLRSTGPITLSTGDQLTSESLVPLLLNEIYQRYNTGNAEEDNRLQDVVYGEAVSATFARLTSGSLDPKALVGAMQQGFAEHRLLLWSQHPDEQTKIDEFGLARTLPASDEKVDRVGVYFQDNVGSKLNYYLSQSVVLQTGMCRADGRQSYRITVDLENRLQPEQVPSTSISVLGNYAREQLPPGLQRVIVMLYAPPGSQIIATTVDGVSVAAAALHDTDYPVGKLVVSIAPGAHGQVTYDVVAPAQGEKTLEAEITPMVNRTTITNASLDCATVAGE